MTCIVGIAHNGKVFIGGDSAGVGGYNLNVRADKKVFRNGEFVMGFTSSFRMGNLLQHSLEPPRWHPDDDIHKFMVKDFVDAVRSCLKTGGYATKENDGESGGTFLVGFKGRLFVVDSDYQVGENVDGFASVGCGEDIALGSMYTSKGSPKGRVLTALAAAERFSAGVRAPFHVEVA
ncbi:hypothetical protein LB579_28610 [Mesorhizobium sp. BR1-1-7]|uniref:hypothetical protein n=1 Tax=Mesorhizobium sp. BR1-1-7 TaxID=2876647 RepID=UPI001CCA9171|nr:hypothetical protein [Mesorhizobium sp. BR1-1-7]MBZ9921663.1 hypothetical protein [Mesorhizobium sp. BR1-1-7]